MLLSEIKYEDPTAVLEFIVDDSGNNIEVYQQADIVEFFLNFLDRLQDGFGENKKLKLNFKRYLNLLQKIQMFLIMQEELKK